MHRVNTGILLGLTTATLSAAVPPMDYHGEITGYYDSNIGQNIQEKSKVYVAPSMGVKLYSPAGNMFSRLDLAYELHVVQRAPKYNNPLIDIGFGGEFKANEFTITPELSGAIWYANRVSIVSDNSFKEHSFVIAQRAVTLDVPMKLNYSRHQFKLDLTLAFTDDIGRDNDGVDISMAPAWKYRFKTKRHQPVRIKSVGVGSSLGANLVKDKTNNYIQGEIAPELGISYGTKGGSLTLGGFYDRRMYSFKTIDPQTADSTKELLNAIGGSANLDIPVVSDLHIQIGTKAKLRSSTIISDEWNRFTAYVRIKWSSSVGRDSQ